MWRAESKEDTILLINLVGNMIALRRYLMQSIMSCELKLRGENL